MTGQSFTTLQSAVSSFDEFTSRVQSLNLKKMTAKERTQLSSKVKKQKAQLEKAFTEQLGSINSRLTAAEREHKVKTTPSSNDFAYIQLLAGKNQTQLLDLAKSSTTAARLLASEPGLFGLSKELKNSVSREASPETYAAIEDLDVQAVRVEQLRDSTLQEVGRWAMAYETNAETEAQAEFLNSGDSGEGAGDL
jgi:hypothetical protein